MELRRKTKPSTSIIKHLKGPGVGRPQVPSVTSGCTVSKDNFGHPGGLGVVMEYQSMLGNEP